MVKKVIGINALPQTTGVRKKLIEKIKEDEFAVNGGALNNDYVGGDTKLKGAVDKLLENVSDWESDEKSISNNGATITFYRRLSGTNPTAAAKETDRKNVEKLLGLVKRPDPIAQIENLKLSDAVALFGEDHLRLKQWIRLYHSELDEEDLNQIVISSLRGLRAEFPEIEELHAVYKENLEPPEFNTDLGKKLETTLNSFTILGSCNSPYVQVTGAYTRKIVVRKDGTFQATIPLPRTGEHNDFQIYSFNPEREEKSPSELLQINQIGIKEDTEEAFFRLLALKEEILEAIKENPGRYDFLLSSCELSLLKHFTYNEKAGFNYLSQRIKKEKSPTLNVILVAIQTEFKEIGEMDFGLKAGEHLYFFQKYCIYKIMKAMEAGKRGIILANEQGLGKTVTALALANGENALVITPNPVVSTWIEQEKKFVPKPNLESLEGSYSEREALLEDLDRPQVVVNIEFTRGMTEKRAELLSRFSRMLVIDEADYLCSKESQQSKGTAQIPATFKLLLTATPFKRPSQITNMLAFLHPSDPTFGSRKAFARAYDTDTTSDLNALYLLLHQNAIRIRKKDVFEEYDPNISLEEQSDKLPRKIEVKPQDENTGQFYLLDEQCDSILELFDDYQGWCRKHKTSGCITGEDKQYARFREGYFQKKEALRQIMNNPKYIGLNIESPKHLAMDKIVKKEIAKGKKILIFCRYRDQVEEYCKRYKEYNPCAYYGGLKQNSNGYKVGDDNKVLYYEVDEYGDYILKDGEFIPTDKVHGKPIRALDYERIKFQEDPKSRIIVATYDAGSLGVNFTAADVVIDDDLAPTYRDQYQAGDRAHRIDNERKKYDVTYYWLQALYPESFLERLNPEIRKEYFDCGTFDENHFLGIQSQARVFHRVADGVGSEDEIDNVSLIKERMPFLFDSGDEAEEQEEANSLGI